MIQLQIANMIGRFAFVCFTTSQITFFIVNLVPSLCPLWLKFLPQSSQGDFTKDTIKSQVIDGPQ